MFSLDKEQSAKLLKWVEEQEQKRFGDKERYYGAIGGHLTYCFTPTTLGLITTVIYCKDTKDEAEIDLTDYDW